MFNSGIDQALMYEALKNSKAFVFIDGKGDFNLSREMGAMLRRSRLTQEEMRRRKVRFLPLQVLRPIWAAEGLAPGLFRGLPPRHPDVFLLSDFSADKPAKE